MVPTEDASYLETPVVTRHFLNSSEGGKVGVREGGNRGAGLQICPSPGVQGDRTKTNKAETEGAGGEGRNSLAYKRAADMRGKLRERLEREEEWEILENYSKCGERLRLQSVCCGQLLESEKRCSKKWCPVCTRKIATKRALKYRGAVAEMKWPLFLTLTMANVEDLSFDAVRQLRRAFGKLRHRKLWSQNVAGGVASIEVTNIGNGWHPHLHAVIDAEWLAWKTPKPKRTDSRSRKEKLYKMAGQELAKVWARCLGAERGNIKIKRVSDPDVTKEVLKYSVKASDLVECEGKVGDLIRCLEASRLVTTFGTFFGRKWEEETAEKAPEICDRCFGECCWLPAELSEAIMRKNSWSAS
jgi:Replication protein